MSESEPINMDELTDKQQRIIRASYDVEENTRNAIASQVDSHETYVGDVLKHTALSITMSISPTRPRVR